MTDNQATIDPVVIHMQRLLSGPARPGQTFSMPGANYDALYRTARQIKAALADTDQNKNGVCLGTDDRLVVGAAMLATLAGGPTLLIPENLSSPVLTDLRRQTAFDRIIGSPDEDWPTGLSVIDPQALVDEVESLAADDDLDPDRCWLKWFSEKGADSQRLWSKSARNLLGEVDYLTTRFEIGSGDRILSAIPALHMYGLLLSVLVPMSVCARVAGQTPSAIDAIGQLAADTMPTILVAGAAQYRNLQALADNPLNGGALKVAIVMTPPPVAADGQDLTVAAGSRLVEIYGSPETGGIATRCADDQETGFTPYDCIRWRLAGDSLDIQSPFLSEELPVRSSGWYTAAGCVRAAGSHGFTIISTEMDIGQPVASADQPEKTQQRQIRFEPDGVTVAVDDSQTLQQLAAGHGIAIRADCGGIGLCSKCRVQVDPRENFSPPADAELDALTPDQMADGQRLACQARAVKMGTVSVMDSPAERSESRGKTGIMGTYALDSPVRRLNLSSGSMAIKTDNLPESLLDWLAAQTACPVVATADLAALRQLSRYRGSLKAATVVVHDTLGLQRILDGTQTRSLGLAVDLGTTSIAGYLCDLQTGSLLTAEACVNPQRRFGEDVISRISHINEHDDRLAQFQRLAVEGINVIMARCLERVDAGPESVDEVTLCGNTTMQQIVSGLHPHGLGVFPYFPLTLTPPAIRAGDIGLGTDPAVPVFLMPVISGFIGGDTMAAILADRPHERDEITLIVDIGTNGEVVLGNRERLWTTSCATGPALEGAQISCGMRAVSGAIHRVWPQTDSHRIGYDVLGDQKGRGPMGICGSGIIDTIAALRQIGVVRPNGRLDEAKAGVIADTNGVGRHYTLVDSKRSATGRDIAVTLEDIRQIQLAKGALLTGIEFLMRKAAIHRIDRTILTGAFGARFNWKNALAIGMLPPAVADGTVTPKDNLAGVGVVMALLDKKLRSEARDLCRRVRYLELASDPDFAMAFARATAFPEYPAHP